MRKDKSSLGIAVSGLVIALSSLLGGCSAETEIRGTYSNDSNSGEVIEAVSGERHCDRQSITYLQIGDDRYASDPEGLIPREWRLADYHESAVLPADAVDSGYRAEDGNERVWLASDGKSIFVVGDSESEQWPKVVKGFGCD